MGRAISAAMRRHLLLPGLRLVLRLYFLITLVVCGLVFSASTQTTWATPRPAHAPSLHVSLDPVGDHQGARQTLCAVFHAAGFYPRETVSISWGARNAGAVTADDHGAAHGKVLFSWDRHAGPQSLGLYGTTSGRSLVEIVDPAPRRPARHAVSPPLLLPAVPGPAATLALPLAGRAYRVPVAASAAPPVCIPLAIWWRIRRWRKRRRARRASNRVIA